MAGYQDVIDWQARLFNVYDNPTTRDGFLHASRSASRQQIHGATDADHRRTADAVFDRLLLGLTIATPYYFAGQVCPLVEHGGLTIPDWTLRAEALPTHHGFCWFAEPLALPRSDGSLFRGVEGRNLRAMLWVTQYEYDDQLIMPVPSPGMPPVDEADQVVLFFFTEEKDGPRALTTVPWQIGSAYSEAVDLTEHLIGAAARRRDKMRMFASAMAFMEQRILVPRVQRPERAARRRFEHEHNRPAPDVRVVELRKREQRDYQPEHHGVEWSCQWMVRGHWRNQPYPSLGIHQPIWIMPHLQGPSDKPLKEPSTQVFAVVR